MLLLVHANEEEAFWVLAAPVEHILPEGFFSRTLLPSRACPLVLLDYVQENMPKLVAYLAELGIDLPAICFSWFLSLFIDCLPVETLFRVWYVLLLDGLDVLFRVALGVLKYDEAEPLRSGKAFCASTYLLFCPQSSDVKDVGYVINYDFPNNCEDYIHRIGHTGRAGMKGTSYTYFTTESATSARDLIATLKEAKADVPPALEEMAMFGDSGGCRNYYGGSEGYGNSDYWFGGRDNGSTVGGGRGGN